MAHTRLFATAQPAGDPPRIGAADQERLAAGVSEKGNGRSRLLRPPARSQDIS
jgi:hypothetical protein